MLCETCNAMFQSSEWGSHHPDPTALVNAAESGCYICEPLLQHVLEKYGTLENGMVEPYKYRIYCRTEPASIHVDMTVRKDGTVTRDCQTFVAFSQSELPMRTGVGNRGRTIPLLEATGTAQKWLSDCLHKYGKCQKPAEPQSCPTRLLDLQESTANLILTKEVRPIAPYAALSYCWGPNPAFLRLTASNLQDLQSGVPYQKLPIAFQEAVLVLKSLSIRYVWIDCLCIIQSGPGSIEDWQHECARMQDVYSNCILSLSLAQARDPQRSCLDGYQPKTFLPFNVTTSGLFCNNPSEKRTCTVVSWNYFRQGLYDQPLGYRAWCLQEWLLAPRVLSVGHGELFWDCVELPHASESLRWGFTSSANQNYLDRNETAIPDTSEYEDLKSFWLTIVEEYTERDLTHPETDKLVALSAIATRMSRALDDVYVAGHFWKMLPLSLNWQVQPPLARRRRRDKIPKRLKHLAPTFEPRKLSGTPSWSWASMDGPLFQERYFRDTDEKVLMEAESFTLHLTDEENPTGQVDRALLRIKAYCMECEWRADEPCIPEALDIWQDDLHWLQVNADDPDDQPVDGAKFHLAALKTDHRLGSLEGLVLKAADMEGIEVFERIGHFISGSVTQREDMTLLFKHEKRALILK